MIMSDEETATSMMARYLEQCLASKQDFINIVLSKLKDGDEGTTHITKGKFDSVINASFSRPSNLRHLVLTEVTNSNNAPETN